MCDKRCHAGEQRLTARNFSLLVCPLAFSSARLASAPLAHCTSSSRHPPSLTAMLRAFAASTAPMAARMARAPTRIASARNRHDSPPEAAAAPSATPNATAVAAAAAVASVRPCGARSFHATAATGSYAPGSGSPTGSRSSNGGHSGGSVSVSVSGGGGGGRVLQSEWDLRAPSSAATGGGVEHVISIDRSGLLGQHHTAEAEATEAELAAKSKHTPMVDELRSQIKIRGALSMSDYIFQCLQNQQFGYYTANPAASVIGGKEGADEAAHGDFITSPELGQVFGEVGKTCGAHAPLATRRLGLQGSSQTGVHADRFRLLFFVSSLCARSCWACGCCRCGSSSASQPNFS